MAQELQNRLAGIPLIRRWPGLPPEILINYGPQIQEMVKANKLIPVSKNEAMGAGIKAAAAVTTIDSDLWWWKNGGMKMAHVHYAGEVYALNNAQWEQFSSSILKDFSKKLVSAKSISFNEFADVAEAVAGIG
jgi:hypothetical protein